MNGEGWVEVKDLKPGMEIATEDGDPVTLASIRNTGEIERTFNFEVADFHTYFVGEQRVLVHNCGGKLPDVKKAVNSNLPHASERAVERGVFPDTDSATAGLKELSAGIKKDGFPEGSIPDPAHADRVLVPVGNNGMAAYQVGKNGTAKLKTVLIKQE